MEKSELQPRLVFEHFAKINAIPRPSKREEKIIEYLRQFGLQRGLDTEVDATGNVIIRKPASPGYQNRKTLILQSHTDMVCEKLVDKEIDFDNDPIETYIDGEWLKAKGTTLGADDGIGCAMELAVLDDDTLEHGPIECVFTRDEETGLTGAMGMSNDFMRGDLLINLDSEDEGQFFISCAGGMTTRAIFRYTREEAPKGWFFVKVQLQGLQGGHSGDDINKKRANGIKLLARFARQMQESYGARLASFDSGRMHNAIPRDGVVVMAVPADKKDNVSVDLNVFAAAVQDEYHVTEPGMRFSLATADAQPVLPEAVGLNVVRALCAVHNGVLSMCQDEALAWMVETSSNVASVNTADDALTVVASQRSCVMSALKNMGSTIKALFELAGAEVEQGDGYPAWQPKADSQLTAIVADSYRKLFGREPKIIGIHAGLECGLFSEKYPHLDMVSMGPTMRGVHSPDERLLIPTVQMVWDHLVEILKQIPVKD